MKKIISRVGALPYFLAGVALLLLGLFALRHVVDNFWPIDADRLDLIRATGDGRAEAPQLLQAANTEIVLVFLACVLVAVTGLVLPLAYFLNKRFGKGGSGSFFVVLRQAMWVGIWVAFCTWLQLNRSLGVGVALLVAAVLITLEVLLQVRTRAAALAGQ